MLKLKTALNSTKTVLSKKKYFLIFFLVSFSLFSLSILSKNYQIIFKSFSKLSLIQYSKLIGSLYVGGVTLNQVHATIILISISLLLGITVALMTFKVNSKNAVTPRLNKSGTVGAVLGMATPVCAPCGIGLLSMVGLGGVLTYLPFQGTELGVMSIGLLGYSILHIGNDIQECKSCQINIK
ncbi:hypothetical protein HN992_01755 [Candidatus Woesearchaeota archaeon]|jgi:phosphoglycerol transferase MdoB-like AlkP superfamily enzyme|nr:hypothetical protein [Candidatus Woesearchaeota archaeon]MBT3438602.1 hypothetical protein [Candidatus Woesearchaeota archaeon]MBT4058500.1 hypothetical protein [Candidatus Woesearchaeota archaeon]MBT4207287.1 hypothetical protein [Candidatus Woesearchaeota archaeon]MBT4733191.1 hypothetical protein [Candidatus Woesearchaeota archaeon]